MLGQLVGGLVGKNIAEKLDGGGSGLAGALIGAAVPVVVARVVRMGPIGWAAAIAAGYAAGRLIDRFNAGTPRPPSVSAA